MRREPQGPNWRPAPPRSRWRPPTPKPPLFGFPAFWLGSIAAHVLIAALLIFWPDPRTNPLPPAAPPSFDIVFEGGQPERPEAEPVEGIETPPNPPSPPNQAEIPPPPNAPPVPSQPALPPIQQALPLPPPPTPVPPPPLPPVQQAMQQAQPVPPPPIPPPPIPPPPISQPPIPQPPRPEPPATAQAPLPPLPGTVEIFAPPTELRLPDRLAESLPLPPPPTPTPPPRTPSPQQQQQRPQQAQPNLPGIWAPGGVQLGRPATPPAGRPQARGTDTTVDPRFLEGTPRTDPSVRVTGAQVGADWRAAFRRWLDQNLSYPQRAIALGEDGTVRVQVLANPDGTVRSVRLVGPSTSPSLNFGTTFPFNGARLPAFPPGSDPNGVTIDLTVNYILIRR